MPDIWSAWRAELKNPTPEDRRLDRQPMCGYFRIEGARTKHDEPLAIWREDGQDAFIFQFGSNQPKNTEQHAETWEKFTAGRWLSAIAVPKADWDIALETGRWPDNKPSRPMDAAERLDIDVGSGDNAPPPDAALADQIAALAEVIAKQPEPTTQEAADKLAGDLDRLRALLKLADAEFVKEKAPHLEAGRAVDAKWRGIREPGTSAYDAGEAKRKAFLKREQDRLRKAAEEENARRIAAAEAERKRIADEVAAKLKAEAEARAAEAVENGEDPSEDVPSDEAIAERAAQVAAEAVAPAQTVEAERAVAGSAYGTKRGLRKVTYGVIDDLVAFLTDPQIINRADLKEWAEKVATKAAVSGFTIAGMHKDVREE